MAIRALDVRDLPAVETMRASDPRCETPWAYGADFLGGVVAVDEQDAPRIIIGAWKRAEIHMVCDPTWGTPAERLTALEQLHSEMERSLRLQGVGAVWTWFDAKMRGFGRRLRGLGWIEWKQSTWHRKAG